MKQVLGGGAKWLVVGALVVLVGLLLLLRVGRTRGTRAYRWRMALWRTALGLAGGTFLFLGALGLSSCKEEGVAGTASTDAVPSARKASAQPKPDRLLPSPSRSAILGDVRSPSSEGEPDGLAPVIGGAILEPGERSASSHPGSPGYRTVLRDSGGRILSLEDLSAVSHAPLRSPLNVLIDPELEEHSGDSDWDGPTSSHLPVDDPDVPSAAWPSPATQPQPADSPIESCYIAGSGNDERPPDWHPSMSEPRWSTPLKATADAPEYTCYKPAPQAGGGDAFRGALALSKGKTLTGKIDGTQLDNYLRQRSSALLKCFLMAARQNGRTTGTEGSGTITLEITIQPTGRASATVVKDTVKLPRLSNCLVARLGGWQFPRPEGKPAVVRVGLDFKARWE